MAKPKQLRRGMEIKEREGEREKGINIRGPLEAGEDPFSGEW